MHRHAQLNGNYAYSPQIKEALNRALESNPEYAMGWALLGETYLDNHAMEYSGSNESLDIGHSYARRAIHHDKECQYANFVLAYSHILRGDPVNAIRAAERVLILNPHAAFLVGGAAIWLCIAGDFDRGLAHLNRSLQLNPHYPRWFHHASFLFHLKRGDFEKARIEAERFHIPDFFWSYIDKTVAAGLSGNVETARANLNRLLALIPDFAHHRHYYLSAFVIEEDLMEKMVAGLEKAGLKEL